MQSSLAIGQIDICLLPEVPFNLHGPHGVLSHLKYLIESKGSTVVCVAEGARQEKLNKYDNEDGTSRSLQDRLQMLLVPRPNEFSKSTH
ncbi:ATP-dependent 6-phosphofructokinase 5, chloroplastic [Trifolium repens]|nr:ATP-dependent 6-phosphofructokinase 5, chloroplastic [Trifolium repens]